MSVPVFTVHTWYLCVSSVEYRRIFWRVQRDVMCHNAIGRGLGRAKQLPRLYTITNAIIISQVLFTVPFHSATAAAAAAAALVFPSFFVYPCSCAIYAMQYAWAICISSSFVIFYSIATDQPYINAGLNCFISFASIYSPAADLAGAAITMFLMLFCSSLFHLGRFFSPSQYVVLCSICSCNCTYSVCVCYCFRCCCYCYCSSFHSSQWCAFDAI